MRKRKYKRRKKAPQIKSQTIYSILGLIVIFSSAIITLSFFQQGTALDSVSEFVREKFDYISFLLPLVLISIALPLFRIRSIYTSPRISIGMILIFITLITSTKSGTYGGFIWESFTTAISPLGTIILMIIMLFIGLMVLFNTSIEEVASFVKIVIEYFSSNLSKQSSKKEKKFAEHLVVKKPIEFPSEKAKIEKKEQKPEKESKIQPTKSLGLGTTVVSNPQVNEIWEYPPTSLLLQSPGQKADRGDMKQNAEIIEKTLESFGINAKVVEVNLGPAVTQYALEIAIGTKLSKITALSNDLALALAAPTGQIRIEAPIPGRRMVGIEIPNRSLEFVTMKHMLSEEIMKNSRDKLLVALGLDVSGDPICANISKMPHVLIAGTTGSGKSVLINSWIASLLFRTTPNEVKMILVDPKRVELTLYNGIPHLLTPVIVEPDQILSALRWSIGEMNRRYKMFQEIGVRNIDGYNEQAGFQALPYIVIFIDELADLMAYAPAEVEDSICRLAQMARATGIHLVVATQRPSVDVITGLIKANIPSRIAFNVSSMIDSRVVLDMPGAERLLGRGDMLYIPPDQAKPTRIQGTFVTEAEIGKLVDFLKSKKIPVQYTEEVTSIAPTWKKGSGPQGQSAEDGKDNLFEEAVKVVCQYDRASASLLQRRLSIGYARAARILDQLDNEGIVGQGEGSKPRDVLMKNPQQYFAGKENSPEETQ